LPCSKALLMPWSPDRLKLCHWHRCAGVLLLGLALIRLLWRLTHRSPPMPDAIARTMPTHRDAACARAARELSHLPEPSSCTSLSDLPKAGLV